MILPPIVLCSLTLKVCGERGRQGLDFVYAQPRGTRDGAATLKESASLKDLLKAALEVFQGFQEFPMLLYTIFIGCVSFYCFVIF